MKKIDSDLEFITKLYGWGKWQRFKWKFWSKATKFRFLKENVSIKVDCWYDDIEKEYKYQWEIKRLREK